MTGSARGWRVWNRGIFGAMQLKKGGVRLFPSLLSGNESASEFHILLAGPNLFQGLCKDVSKTHTRGLMISATKDSREWR